MPAPFRSLFVIAALDAILGATIWTLPASDLQSFAPLGHSAGEWHRNVLLFGTVPAIFGGFLLTALPRWTKQPPVSRTVVRSLVALWVAGRSTFLFVRADAGLALFGLFVLSLLVLLAGSLMAARDGRNLKIVLVLSVYCVSVALTALSCELELALRMAVASVVGLVVIIGGRVIPALTMAYVERRGSQIAIGSSAAVERFAATATAFALGGWVAMPQTPPIGPVFALTACAQILRLAQWCGWRAAASPAVLILHIGYAWVACGFAFLAIHALSPTTIGPAAAIHAWMIGGIGAMGLAIMASMIRKHSGRAFVSSRAATAAFAFIFLSCLARLVIEFLPSVGALFTSLSASAWILAFAFFLVSYGRMLK